GDPLELANSAVLELEAGACDEVTHGARDENVARTGLGGDARADRDGDAGHLAVEQRAFAGVQARADVKAQPGQILADGARAADSTRRTVEAREKAVSRGVELDPAVTGQLITDARVMLREQLSPAAVAELRSLCRRADEIGEGHRRQDAVGF